MSGSRDWFPRISGFLLAGLAMYFTQTAGRARAMDDQITQMLPDWLQQRSLYRPLLVGTLCADNYFQSYQMSEVHVIFRDDRQVQVGSNTRFKILAGEGFCSVLVIAVKCKQVKDAHPWIQHPKLRQISRGLRELACMRRGRLPGVLLVPPPRSSSQLAGCGKSPQGGPQSGTASHVLAVLQRSAHQGPSCIYLACRF